MSKKENEQGSQDPIEVEQEISEETKQGDVSLEKQENESVPPENDSDKGDSAKNFILKLADKYNIKKESFPAIILTVVLVLLIIIAAIIGGKNYIPKNPKSMKLSVTSEKSFVDDGTFSISGFESLSKAQIEENLVFNPTVKYEITELKNGNAFFALTDYRNVGYKGTLTIHGENSQKTNKTFEVNYPPLSVIISSGTVQYYNTPINLTFSEQVDIDSLSEHISITPKTNFTLSYDLNNVFIVPDSEWIVTDNYQITINARYASKTGKEFAEKQILQFSVIGPDEEIPNEYTQTPATPRVAFFAGDNFILGEHSDMTLSFLGEYLAKSVPVLVETYRMDNLTKYREQGSVYLDTEIGLDSLEKIDSNAFAVIEGQNQFKVKNWGEGCYVISAKYKDPETKKNVEIRTSYQVTPISVYMQSSGRETLVWLNNTQTGSPLANHVVSLGSLEDSPKATTDSSGVAVIPIIADDSNYSPHFTVTDQSGELVYYDNSDIYNRNDFVDRYYSFLFLDRSLYRPQDNVQFWGYVKSFRYNERELPESMTITFAPGELDIEVEAEISSSGVFTGEIPLEMIKSGQYSIKAELVFPPDEEKGETEGTRVLIESEYVSVKEFDKPTYIISSKIDKTFYGAEDKVKVTTSAAFYDGTPLPLFPLEVSYYNPVTRAWVRMEDIKTDSTGNATFSFPASPGSAVLYDSENNLRVNSYKVQISADGEQITHVSGYRYFPSDIVIETSLTRPDGSNNVDLSAKTYKVDFKSPNLIAAVAQLDEFDTGGIDNGRLLLLAKGDPIDVDLNLSIYWQYTDTGKITRRNTQSTSEGGEYVKFDNWYSLDHTIEVEREIPVVHSWETQEKRVSVTTVDGNAILKDIIFVKEGVDIDWESSVNVRASITYFDSLKNESSKTAFFPSDSEDYWSTRNSSHEPPPVQGLSYNIIDNSSGDDLTPTSDYYRNILLNADQNYSFTLLEDGEPIERSGKILYTLIQEGLYEYHIANSTNFTLDYRIDHGSGVRLVSAFFDGEKAQYIKQLDLDTANPSLGLDVVVTPDKESYRPGETVRLNVKSTDYLGRGVSGDLCISVVDESIFALSEQELDVLYDLYINVRQVNNYVELYCTTYRSDEYAGSGMWDGGKGSGGVEFYDSYRSNFKDTAVFIPTVTDANGNSVVEFQLPDNTTSWRVTAVEIADNLRAGSSKSNVISTLPFFMQPVLTTKYIDGDDISMLVQGHGVLLDETSEIEYTVTVVGDGFHETLTGKGKAYQPVEVNFGKLPIGSYTMTARAQFGGYSDTVELPLSVLKSNLELVVNKQIDIGVGKDLDIAAVRYPVTLTLYDKNNEAYLASINSLFGHYCMHANQRMSRFVAKRVIGQSIPDMELPYYISDNDNNYVNSMQNYDGGIGYYPGDVSEPLITTYVLQVARDQFNLKSMTTYYRGVLEYNKDEKIRAACYLGLAVIGDIETKEITDVLADKANIKMSIDAKAYYVAALAYLQETELANEIYNKELSPLVKTAGNKASKDLDWQTDAASIWVAASLLNDKDADNLSLEFGGKGWRYRTLFEAMIYVTNFEREVAPSRFSYSIKGKVTNGTLGLDINMHTMVLSKSDLESLAFSEASDSLTAVAYYVGEPTEIGYNSSDNMTISKTVHQIDDNTYEVKLNINFKDEAPTGDYDISEWIPSNSRLYDHDTEVSHEDYYINYEVEQEGQKLYIAFSNPTAVKKDFKFTYRIRQTYQSEAVLDTAYMIHGLSGENCNSKKDVFRPAKPKSGGQVISLQK